MKVIEILRISRKIMEVLQESCINISDVRYVDLYDDYERLAGRGEKISYIVAFLSEKYGISERKIYYLLKKFNNRCKIGAA